MASFKKSERTGKWYFIIDIGNDPITGTRRQKTISKDSKGRKFETEGAARIAADKMEDEIERGKKFDSVSLKDYITKFYDTHVKGNVAESTYIMQWGIARNYIIPYLGKYKVDKLTDEHIETAIAKMQRDGIKKPVIKNALSVLRKTLRFAQKKRIILENPMTLVNVPTYKPLRKKVWSIDDVNLFLEVTKSSKLYILYVLALSTGARRGELLALTWDDIDLDKGTVTISKSVKYSGISKLHVSTTKTENSLRTINIPEKTIIELRKHKENQMEGVNIVADNLGQYFNPNEASRHFLKDCARYKMPKIRFHDMRHTHATILLQNKINPNVVAERLGDTVEMVLKTYAHVLPSMQEEVAETLNKIF